MLGKRLPALFFLIFLIVMVPLRRVIPGLGLPANWLLVAGGMLVLLIVSGIALDKGPHGVLIDPLTNTMSLSRFQVVLWTWVVLSAFFTLTMARVWDAQGNAGGYVCPPPAKDQPPTCAEPLGVQIPAEIWALLGISLTSAVGAPLLKAAKAQRTADHDQAAAQANARSTQAYAQAMAAVPDDQRDRFPPAPAPARSYRAVLERRQETSTLPPAAAAAGAAAALPGQPPAADDEAPSEGLTAIGAVVRKPNARDAAFSDIFTGEEVSTFGYVDIGKLQNLLFTVVGVVAYAVAIWNLMATLPVASFFAFPDPGPALLALIAISHSGYLVDKSATHSVPE